MRKLLLPIVPLGLLFLASCQPDVTMWAPCSNAPGVDPTGTDKTYVLVCKEGTWTPVMTVDEFVRIRQGKPVTIAPLPTNPNPTSSTTTSTTTTTVGGPTSTTSTTLAPNPVINSLSPLSGPAAGGTAITIGGSNFTGTTSVTIGGVPATSVVVVNDNQITAITPAHAAGPADLTVTTGAGFATQSNVFTFV